MIIRFVHAASPSPRSQSRILGCFRSILGALLPAALMCVGASSAHAASVTLQWDPPTDAATSGYVVWYGNSAGNYTAWVDIGFLTTYKVEGLAEDTAYCFAIKAYAASGETSDFSDPVCTRTAKPEPPPPTAPSDPTTPPAETSDGTEIVLYAANAVTITGNWMKVTNTTAAGDLAMRGADKGWSAANAPLSSPTHYLQLKFDAHANTPYRIWLRLRATANSKWNDSVWVQFSNSLVSGKAAYRIGTSSALLVNLEPCDSCGVSEWGWVNSAYWLTQGTAVMFAQSGPQTVRIQTREDGVEIDQVVLSKARFMLEAPGDARNDTTILPRTISAVAPASTPYGSAPIVLPGTIPAAHFDRGGAGVAYVDSTSGNAGGVFRATDVDLQAASTGGYNIGWTTAGEWVHYSVNAKTSRSYTLLLKVASVGGGSLQLVAGAPSTASRTVTIPNTGGWQTWTTVSVPMTLAAGKQVLTVKFLTANVNLRSIIVQ